MPSRISRVVGKAKEDTATVLTTGQRWESLRAGFWGGSNHPELAIDCRNRAKEYEAALTNHLNNQKKG